MKKKSRKVLKATQAKLNREKQNNNTAVESDSDADVDDSIFHDERDDKDNELSTDDELIRHEEDSSEEEEVLPITDDEKDESDDDEEEYDEEAGLPNRDAWGKNKSSYYNADFVDEDRSRKYREEDAEKAQAELEEALAIQRSVSKYTNVCLTEELQLEMVDESAKPEQEGEADFDALTVDQKLKLIKKKCPEVLLYKKELMEKMDDLQNRMIPLVLFAKEGKIISEEWIKYINLRYEILVHYCLNMSYYFVLKSKGDVPSNHPIFQRVNEFKTYLTNADNETESIIEDLDLILNELKENDGVDLDGRKKATLTAESPVNGKKRSKEVKESKPKKSKDMKSVRFNIETPHEKEVASLYKETRQMDMEVDSESDSEIDHEFAAQEQDAHQDEENDIEGDEKRKITYQIAKNKGLTPKRKKECRNPRVHNKMKYRKAKIRRKGQVRNVYKEIKRYDGEPTGISAHVVKSIKFK